MTGAIPGRAVPGRAVPGSISGGSTAALAGAVSAKSTLTGTLSAKTALSATSKTVSALFGSIPNGANLTAALTTTSSLLATLTAFAPDALAGSIASASTLSGTLYPTGAVIVTPAAIPSYTLPTSAGHDISYIFTSTMFGDILAELPLTSVTFSLTLNNSGPFQGTFNVEDPRVAQQDWIDATAPYLASVWVLVDGVPVYGGIVTTRRYSSSSQTITIGASDQWFYLGQRIQAFDYSSTWVNPADPMQIAAQVMTDALATANSIAINVAVQGSTPSNYWVSMSYPISQFQAVSDIVTQLQQMSYLVGFDFACDPQIIGGFLVPQVTLSYPRRGRIAGSTGLVIMVGADVDFEYDEDGTQMANQIYETASGSGGVASVASWAPAITQGGYPITEKVTSHTSMNSTPWNQSVLDATVAGDLQVSAYPPVAPVVTIPLFGDPQLGDYIVGDDVRVIVPQFSGPGVVTNPRFPHGMDFYFRIIQIDVTIGNEGLSTAALTLNMPPSSIPIQPPL